ncbi:MAG: Endonuclease III [Fimbriimonadales bacterium]|nr:Endonuclease III [Fimbriimonadales bacterium]
MAQALVGQVNAARKRKALKALSLLEAEYGVTEHYVRMDPMDELVSCILSQHTSDANSFPTFFALRTKYPDWSEIAKLKPTTLADEIRSAGLANQKAKAILATLREIKSRVGDYSLELLHAMDTDTALEWLCSLPGVGPKTAAIVMCFSFGRPVVPVDTHVHRVSKRLGLTDEKTSEAQAHRILRQLIRPELAFRFHVALIEHGRRTCKARTPLCGECVLRRFCPSASSGVAPNGRLKKRMIRKH